jgi:phosphoglycolate phosphatase
MAAGPDGKAILYPGIRDVLDRLQRDDFTLLATATGMSRRGLDRIIAQHGLERHFQSTQVADTHPSKPNPSMIHAALSETGVSPSHTVMIGDTSYDIQMGKSAGVGTIGVTWGNHTHEYLAGADHIVETADELMCTLNVWIEERA